MSAIAEIQRRVQDTLALIQQYERQSQRPDAPQSIFANIRSLEKLRRKLERDFEEAARQEEMEGVRILRAVPNADDP